MSSRLSRNRLLRLLGEASLSNVKTCSKKESENNEQPQLHSAQV
jgi:hypothetical protein